jgi:hypothetical protein
VGAKADVTETVLNPKAVGFNLAIIGDGAAFRIRRRIAFPRRIWLEDVGITYHQRDHNQIEGLPTARLPFQELGVKPARCLSILRRAMHNEGLADARWVGQSQKARRAVQVSSDNIPSSDSSHSTPRTVKQDSLGIGNVMEMNRELIYISRRECLADLTFFFTEQCNGAS